MRERVVESRSGDHRRSECECAVTDELSQSRAAFLDRVASEIETLGWHVTVVEDTPRYAHTTGLTKSFAHPEILVIGLPVSSIAEVVHEAARQVAAGARFRDEETSSTIFDGLSAAFRAVPLVSVLDYCAAARAYYDFPPDVLQLVWPDAQGRWPWDANADAVYRLQQPVLADLAGRDRTG